MSYTKEQISKFSDSELIAAYKNAKKIVDLQNTLQQAFKVCANSLFGICGNEGFIFYDHRLAEGITHTGQFILRYIGNHMDMRLNEFFKTKDLKYVYYGDTDSLYMAFGNVVEKYYKGKTDLEITSALDKLMEQHLRKFVNEATDHIASVQNYYKKTIKFKREAIGSGGFWCVHPDTNIFTDKGELNIVDLFNSIGSTDDIREVTNINCLSVSTNNSEIIDTITHVMRKQYSGDMYTISTPNGYSVKVTANHLVLVLSKIGQEWVMAKNLCYSDTIVDLGDVGYVSNLTITKEHYDGWVYDISVKENANFFANGICVHNCGKKKYALKVYNNEGVQYNDGDYKILGLEVVRSSTPAIARKALKECVIHIINKDIEKLRSVVAVTHGEFKVAAIEQIAFPRSANNLVKYSSETMIYSKGTPIAVRGALLHNHFMQKLNLTDMYQSIEEGARIKFIYLKEPNHFKENIIAFEETLPKEFNLDKYIDRELQFDKVFTAPLDGILKAVGWELEEKSSLDDFF